MKGYLLLEDGSVFEGSIFGATDTCVGEVVFNTGMTGYQEILTDPSYYGQIVTMTYPLIGNYGINPDDFQSWKPHLKGLIVHECCKSPSHWQSFKTLDEYLRDNGVVGLEGIDTRALTRRLRQNGTIRGVIATEKIPAHLLGNLLGSFDARDAVYQVSTDRPYRIFGDGPRITLIDLGVKASILRRLTWCHCDITVVPASMSAPDILDTEPDGIILSNGPGDPKQAGAVAQTVSSLIGRLPMMGICLGHQVLALAFGADTFKLKYGHRGSNHPVKELATNRITITSQNHGYAVDESSLRSTGLKVTHVNLNDGTVEGLSHPTLPIFSVQFHPEAGPGPEDSMSLFDLFIQMVTPMAKAG